MDSWLSTGSFGGAKRGAQSQGTSRERVSSPSLKRPKVSDSVPHPPSDKVFFCNREIGHARQDAGFVVLRWGTNVNDVLCMTHEYEDTIPDGFKICRRLTFKLAHDQFFREGADVATQVTEDDGCISLKLTYVGRRGSSCEEDLVCATRWKGGLMQYAIKAGQASTAEESFWQSSMTAAQSAFCQRHGYLSQTSLSGPRLFGIQCPDVQAHLTALRESRYFYVYRTHSLGHEEGCHSRGYG